MADIEAAERKLHELRTTFREQWLQKSRSAFDCQECGIQANLLDELDTALDAMADGFAALKADIGKAMLDADYQRAVYENEAAALKARIVEMERVLEISTKALEPFSDRYRLFVASAKHFNHPIRSDDYEPAVHINYGQLRAAKEAFMSGRTALGIKLHD